MKRSELKQLFSESFKRRILEQESPKTAGADTPEDPVSFRKPKLKSKPAKDSVDDQIDALLLRYETSSIRSEPSLNESLSSLNQDFYLNKKMKQRRQTILSKMKVLKVKLKQKMK